MPSSVSRLGRNDVKYLDLNEPDITTPIIMSYRSNDTSPQLAKLNELVQEPESRPKLGT